MDGSCAGAIDYRLSCVTKQSHHAKKQSGFQTFRGLFGTVLWTVFGSLLLDHSVCNRRRLLSLFVSGLGVVDMRTRLTQLCHQGIVDQHRNHLVLAHVQSSSRLQRIQWLSLKFLSHLGASNRRAPFDSHTAPTWLPFADSIVRCGLDRDQCAHRCTDRFPTDQNCFLRTIPWSTREDMHH